MLSNETENQRQIWLDQAEIAEHINLASVTPSAR